MLIGRGDVVENCECRGVLTKCGLIGCICIEVTLRIPTLIVQAFTHFCAGCAITRRSRRVAECFLQVGPHH